MCFFSLVKGQLKTYVMFGVSWNVEAYILNVCSKQLLHFAWKKEKKKIACVRAKLDAFKDPPSSLLVLQCLKLDKHVNIKDERIPIHINFHTDFLKMFQDLQSYFFSLDKIKHFVNMLQLLTNKNQRNINSDSN